MFNIRMMTTQIQFPVFTITCKKNDPRHSHFVNEKNVRRECKKMLKKQFTWEKQIKKNNKNYETFCVNNETDDYCVYICESTEILHNKIKHIDRKIKMVSSDSDCDQIFKQSVKIIVPKKADK